ncbi:High mobility group [Micractinium conductrix]|uniref:High mobility group n=1 Tax=Micractinium conductrix TaxID=554055 RepID=A0A2P6VRE6_9CHLO|nr:High mobility group [Micractinium conductrix]|eukprot:PSC76676.1 High mobility group [Micractinium conductrix]
MPVKTANVRTGVPQAQIVKAAAQRNEMSQGVDRELAELEALMQEDELVATQPAATQLAAEEEPAGEAAEEAAEEEDVEAALAALSSVIVDEEEEEEEKEMEGEPQSVAAAAVAPADAPEAEPVPAAAAAPSPVAAAPVPAPVPAVASGGAKAPVIAKRKPGLSVKKSFAAPAAKPAAAPAAAPVPAKKALVTKLSTKPAPAPAAAAAEANAAADAPASAPASQAAPAAAAEAAPPAAQPPKLKGKAAPRPKPAVKAAAAAAGAAAPAAAGDASSYVAPKKPLNPYMHFQAAQRTQIKADNPGLDNRALTAKVAEMYNALTSKEKQPYLDQAAADKERYATELVAAGPPPPAGPKVKRAKSAYQAGISELSKQLSAAWKEVGEEEKKEWQAKHLALKAQIKAAGGEAEPEGSAPAGGKKRCRPAGAAGAGKKQKKAKGKAAEETAAAAAEEEEEEGAAAMQEGEESDEDDEAERLACDWAAHPAELILSHTKNGHFLVLRKGLGISEYGLVEAAAVKAQRLGGASDCPVPLAMLEEYEAFQRAFKREVHDNTEAGDLVLSDLPEGSLLESCAYLGRLQNPGYELHRAAKGDIVLKVPLLGLCSVVQRMLGAERARADALEQRLLALEGGAGGSAAAAGPTPVKAGKKAALAAAQGISPPARTGVEA